MAARRLHLLRHAKSSWDDASLTDHDRPLAPRGRAACAKLAAYCRTHHIAPDLVLCSSAVRARETLAGIRDGLPADMDVEVEEGLYGAGGHALLERLRAVPEAVGAVLLVGHNPGMEVLAGALADDHPGDHPGDHPPVARLWTKYPTGALASFTFDGSWADLEAGSATLTAFVVPREL
jgi:phosphohistidine phosphatase